MTFPHGSVVPGSAGIDRSNHVIEGVPETADEAASLALSQVAADRGRVLYQTGGVRPGWYLMDGTGGLILLAGLSGKVVDTYTSGPVTVVPGVDVYLIDATSGSIQVNLPAAISGAEYTVKKIDASANTVTIKPLGETTIDDAINAVITAQYTSVPAVSDGTNWWIL